MANKLDTHLYVGRVLQSQLYGDLKHVLAKERHPSGAVGLLQVPTGRQRGAAVEDAYVVQPEEATFEGVVAGAVLTIDPPGEIEQQLLEGALEPLEITPAAPGLLQAIGEDRGPGMHWRVDIAEVPLVGGKLPARVHVGLLKY